MDSKHLANQMNIDKQMLYSMFDYIDYHFDKYFSEIFDGHTDNLLHGNHECMSNCNHSKRYRYVHMDDEYHICQQIYYNWNRSVSMNMMVDCNEAVID